MFAETRHAQTHRTRTIVAATTSISSMPFGALSMCAACVSVFCLADEHVQYMQASDDECAVCTRMEGKITYANISFRALWLLI